MGFTSWRGTVGVIKPTRRPGSLEEFIRLMPVGVGVLPFLLDIREGSAGEFQAAFEAAETKIAEVAQCEVDLIHPQGAPPFMFQGYEGERRVVGDLERKYGVPIVTSGMLQVAALRALGLRRIITVTRSAPENAVNRMVEKYLTEAGFDVTMSGMDLPFADLGQLSQEAFYTHVKQVFLQTSGCEGIHILGSGWRLLEIIEVLERDLEIPVVHPVTSRVWGVQRRLHVREPVQGYGKLLATMPALPE